MNRNILLVSAGGIALILLGSGWMYGLLGFAEKLPRKNLFDEVTWAERAKQYYGPAQGRAVIAVPPFTIPLADGVVVLTGGSLRIAAGLRLLLSGKTQKLFISGVNFDEGLNQQIATLLTPGLRLCCVELGRKAGDTFGNATETAEWVKRHNLRSLYVVTASYHMPRTLSEFRHALPASVEIFPYPVFPAEFNADHWWDNGRSRLILIREYNKYLLSRFLSVRYFVKVNSSQN
ncbi:MAG: YdcF family protein [Alphaproteobacteria bacterium]|nr:YdcF family protein [Alphaproteobacteria bacterium]